MANIYIYVYMKRVKHKKLMLFQQFRPEARQRPVRDDRFPRSYATLSTMRHFAEMHNRQKTNLTTGLTHRTTQLLSREGVSLGRGQEWPLQFP